MMPRDDSLIQEVEGKLNGCFFSEFPYLRIEYLTHFLFGTKFMFSSGLSFIYLRKRTTISITQLLSIGTFFTTQIYTDNKYEVLGYRTVHLSDP